MGKCGIVGGIMEHQIATTVQGYPIRPGGVYLPRRAQGIQALALWKNDTEAPDSERWLRQEIGSGFQQMVCLALSSQPAAEMLPMTAEMWVMTIGYGMIEELDRERIRKGFGQLFRTLNKWPQPVELLKILPARPRRAKLPEPDIDPVNHAANAEKLQNILDMLAKG